MNTGMMKNNKLDMGRILIFTGLFLVFVGFVVLLLENSKFLDFFGHLPGDIRVEKPGFKFYFPITSLLLLSLLLNIIIWILRKLF